MWTYLETNNIPILGICYGMQEISVHYGGVVSPSADREFGRASLLIREFSNRLFEGVGESEEMWMSHGDKVTSLPSSFTVLATFINNLKKSENNFQIYIKKTIKTIGKRHKNDYIYR